MAILILVATLSPGTGPPLAICEFCGEDALADVLRNIALFLPLGATLIASGWRTDRALLAGLLLSASVETAQRFIPGRDASTLDVLSNGAGTLAGILLARHARLLLAPPRRLAAWLASVSGLLAVLVISLTAWLAQPSFLALRYYGQWTPQFGDMAWYDGHLAKVELGRRPLPSWRLLASDSVRADLLAGARLHVQGVAGPRTGSLAPIFSIADEGERFVLMLAADRGDLVLRYRARGRSWRLDQPELRAAHALDGVPPGAPLDLTVDSVGPRACFGVNGSRSCPRVGPLAGWQFLAHPDRPTPLNLGVLTVVWGLILLVPPCYWGVRAAQWAR